MEPGPLFRCNILLTEIEARTTLGLALDVSGAVNNHVYGLINLLWL